MGVLLRRRHFYRLCSKLRPLSFGGPLGVFMSRCGDEEERREELSSKIETVNLRCQIPLGNRLSEHSRRHLWLIPSGASSLGLRNVPHFGGRVFVFMVQYVCPKLGVCGSPYSGSLGLKNIVLFGRRVVVFIIQYGCPFTSSSFLSSLL